MKKKLSNPGFEFIFATGVIAILILPPMVMGQNRKDINVMINNGDTVVNGKNIKSLSSAERKDALKDIEQISNGTTINNDGKEFKSMTMTRRKDNGDKESNIIIEREDFNGKRIPMSHFKIKRDSTEKGFRTQILTENGENMRPRFKFEKPSESDRFGDYHEFKRMRGPFTGQNHKNTQSFSYASTNNDGISTHVDFNVSDANRENLKRITGAEKAELVINDLNLTPSFSTGKTNLSFALTEKGNADVWLKDSDGKILWSAKASGNFYKSFELPQNGIYYLQIKQNGKLGLRKIIKEQ